MKRAGNSSIDPVFAELEPRLLLSSTPVVGARWVGAWRSSIRDDYGNTFATATPASVSAAGALSLAGQVNDAGDVDVLSIIAPLSGTLRVNLSLTGSRNRLDATLTAYSATQAQLASNNSPTSGAASVSLAVTAGQRYYLRISGATSRTGAYALSAATTAPAPDPTPPPPTPPPAPSGGFLPGALAYSPQSAVTEQILSTSAGEVLVILGTDGADVITLSQAAGSTTVATAAASQTFTQVFAGLAVYGFDGSDVVRLTHAVTGVSVLYLGGGADQAFESSLGVSTVYGDLGEDLLVSVGGGADTLYGGDGLDSFWADSADTIADAAGSESTWNVHKISSFYQPVPTDPGKAVPLEIDGQNLVDPSTSGTYVNFASRPLFADTPEFDDIAQGAVGDCYFLASLSSLAQTDPNIIRQAIAPMGDGTFAVRFFQNGRATYVRVDGQLPTYSGGSLRYAQLTGDGETWVALAEKAYAQFRTGANSYSSLDGGWMATVYNQLTNLVGSSLSTASKTAGVLGQYLVDQLAAGHAVTAGSVSSPSSPIVGSHAYVVRSAQYVNGAWTVTVYNPWGEDGASYDSNAGDGLLTISMDLFRRNFSDLAVCTA